MVKTNFNANNNNKIIDCFELNYGQLYLHNKKFLLSKQNSWNLFETFKVSCKDPSHYLNFFIWNFAATLFETFEVSCKDKSQPYLKLLIWNFAAALFVTFYSIWNLAAALFETFYSIWTFVAALFETFCKKFQILSSHKIWHETRCVIFSSA